MEDINNPIINNIIPFISKEERYNLFIIVDELLEGNFIAKAKALEVEQSAYYQYKKKYLFCWNDVPGSDNEKLKKILKTIDWVKRAKIDKINEGKTIRVSKSIKGNISSILLTLNDDKTKVNLEIVGGRTDEFVMETEDGKLNVYRKNLEISDSKTILLLNLLHDRDPEKFNDFLKNALLQTQERIDIVLDYIDSKFIEISGPTKNLKVLMDALALPRSNKSTGKGDNLEFPYRKIIVNQKLGGLLAARQKNNSVYSQVICRSDVETPFVKIKGEGDIIFYMAKALQYIKELSAYETVTILHNTQRDITIFMGIKENDYKDLKYLSGDFRYEYEIDDARNDVPTPCGCPDPKTCTKCNGRGTVPSPALGFQNPISVVPPNLTPYAKVGVQFDIDTSIIKDMLKTNKKCDEWRLQFNSDNLTISSENSGALKIAIIYAVNNMVGKSITLGSDFRNIFNSLDSKVVIQAEDVPDNEQSVYVAKNDMGFHTGIKLQSRLKFIE